MLIPADTVHHAISSAVVFLFKASILNMACIPNLGCATERIITFLLFKFGDSPKVLHHKVQIRGFLGIPQLITSILGTYI